MNRAATHIAPRLADLVRHAGADGDVGYCDEGVHGVVAQAAVDWGDRDGAVGKLGLDGIDVHGGRVGYADEDVDEHLAAAFADLAQDGQAAVADGVGDGAPGGGGAVLAVYVDAHAELEHVRCGWHWGSLLRW